MYFSGHKITEAMIQSPNSTDNTVQIFYCGDWMNCTLMQIDSKLVQVRFNSGHKSWFRKDCMVFRTIDEDTTANEQRILLVSGEKEGCWIVMYYGPETLLWPNQRAIDDYIQQYYAENPRYGDEPMAKFKSVVV